MITRRSALAPFLAVLVALGPAWAQAPAAPSPAAPTTATPLPPGHPPPTSAPSPRSTAAPGARPPAATTTAGTPLPPGHPPTDAPARGGATGLPPGHPPPTGRSMAAPGRANVTPDSSTPAADLPPGTIEARVLDSGDRPIPNRSVRLGIMRQSVAEGNERAERFATTNAEGVVRFAGLERGSALAYRVTVNEGDALYASAPFNLGAESGQRVVLHVLPVTRDIEQASVGIRSIVYIEPRDDVFQIEAMFRVMNVGATTWVPENVTLRLPEGAKGFTSEEQMSDVRFVKTGDEAARLQGTFTPGQHDVSFRFQVPNEHRSVMSFGMTLPPHIADMRVMVLSSPTMQLEVDGFDAAEPATDQRGQRVLVAQRRLESLADPRLDAVQVTLRGIPTPGVGRWVAVALASAFALAALALTRLRGTKGPSRALPAQDAQKARELLMDELVLLENARAAGDVGPSTYESTKRTLLDAIVRLEIQSSSS